MANSKIDRRTFPSGGPSRSARPRPERYVPTYAEVLDEGPIPEGTWRYVPTPEVPPTLEELCEGVSHCLQDEQIACEWGLVFALLNWPRDEFYALAAEEAFRCNTGSWSHAHWWGLRNLFHTYEGNLEEFREYRAWKYEQLASHRDSKVCNARRTV
jgi:hypothetical protein